MRRSGRRASGKGSRAKGESGEKLEDIAFEVGALGGGVVDADGRLC